VLAAVREYRSVGIAGFVFTAPAEYRTRNCTRGERGNDRERAVTRNER
jgi:hypothetical protein